MRISTLLVCTLVVIVVSVNATGEEDDKNLLNMLERRLLCKGNDCKRSETESKREELNEKLPNLQDENPDEEARSQLFRRFSYLRKQNKRRGPPCVPGFWC